MIGLTRLSSAIALSTILLSGCYESSSLLLDASAARQPITQYDDWTYTRGGTTYHDRVNPRSDGWYNYETTQVMDDGTDGTWAHYTVLLNYLEAVNGMDIYVGAHWDDDEQAYIYRLVVFELNKGWQSLEPDCDTFSESPYTEADRNAAQSAGAELFDTGISEVCFFSTRESLFVALRSIVRNSNFPERVELARQ